MKEKNERGEAEKNKINDEGVGREMRGGEGDGGSKGN